MTLTAVLQIYKIATYIHVTRERNKRSTWVKSVVRTTALRKAVAAYNGYSSGDYRLDVGTTYQPDVRRKADIVYSGPTSEWRCQVDWGMAFCAQVEGIGVGGGCDCILVRKITVRQPDHSNIDETKHITTHIQPNSNRKT